MKKLFLQTFGRPLFRDCGASRQCDHGFSGVTEGLESLCESVPAWPNGDFLHIFWSDGIIYDKADAVIRILLKLSGIYKFIGVTLKIFPVFILNILYDFIARNRYRIFGKNADCLTPRWFSRRWRRDF